MKIMDKLFDKQEEQPPLIDWDSIGVDRTVGLKSIEINNEIFDFENGLYIETPEIMDVGTKSVMKFAEVLERRIRLKNVHPIEDFKSLYKRSFNSKFAICFQTEESELMVGYGDFEEIVIDESKNTVVIRLEEKYINN